MRHDEPTLIAFLAGKLRPHEAAAFDIHLMDCDACWIAVQEDRQGRRLAESMRETAPSSLRDHVRMAVELAEEGPAKLPRRLRWLALPAAALIALGLLFASASLRSGAPHDPPAVAAVVRLARAGATGPPAEVTVGGHRVSVAHYRLGGHQVVVAQSAEHFPMPAGAQPLSPGRESPWAVSRAELRLLCFAGDHPALLAGDVPLQQLEAMAHSLGIS